MSATSGLSKAAAQAAVNEIIAGGADVRLFTTALSYDDTAADLDTKEVSATDYNPVSVPEADFSVTFDVANSTLTLENAASVDFGTTQNNYGEIVEVAIHAPTTDKFIRADEPNDPDITAGETVFFPANEITFTIE
jgi:hypothetical protein